MLAYTIFCSVEKEITVGKYLTKMAFKHKVNDGYLRAILNHCRMSTWALQPEAKKRARVPADTP